MLSKYIFKKRIVRYFGIVMIAFLVPSGYCFSAGYNTYYLRPLVDSRIERVMWQIDPLGFLEYGPALSLELRIFQSTFITPHFRYYYAGLLYHAVYNNFWQSSNVQVIPGSMGFGVSVKSLVGRIQDPGRFYWGGFFEYGFGGYDEKDEGIFGDKLVRESNFLAGAVFGHKWIFRSRRSINLGGVAGASFPNKHGYYLDEEPGLPWHNPITQPVSFYFLVELQFGFPFGK